MGRRNARPGRSLGATAAVAGTLLLLMPTFAMAGDEALPADVRRFLERRAACDHWGGEEPYDKARSAEIARGAARDCRGTDRELARLKKRHDADAAVTARLADVDPHVEAPSPARPHRRKP